MKICFAVCEYNPFHNGHLKHIEYIRSKIAPDVLAVILSGNFTQRGEIAVLDKYTRAKHAILAGADVVFELPTVFATGNAEIFAKGAVKLANAFSGNHVLCFGTESGKKQTLLATAQVLLNETKEFKALYKKHLKSGVSTIKAKVSALEELNLENLDCQLLKTPNNILGIEYTKAILSLGSNLDIHPIIRQGAQYNDQTLYEEISSASAIRKAIDDGNLENAKSSLPEFVCSDLKTFRPNCDDLIFYSVLKDDIAYFHIKDALKAGAIVPAGKGEAKIYEILNDYCKIAKGEIFVTLEPHLQTFSGLNALTSAKFDNPYKYENQKHAFDDAVEKIKEILVRL